MSTFSANILREGRRLPAVGPVRLVAGPVQMLFEPETGFVRHLRLNGLPALLGIYAAVRDRNWGTVPCALSNLHIDQNPRSFSLNFTAHCRQNEIDFEWQGSIEGDEMGTVQYIFNGKALSDFQRNRIGFCILHGVECAGRECTVESVDGDLQPSAFPEFISPHQPFQNLRAIAHPVGESGRVEVRMEGDTFEMEDQRNWTDASFKTYCTPLSQPFPVDVRKGDCVRQAVTFRVLAAPAPPSVSTTDDLRAVNVQIDWNDLQRLPAHGFGIALDAVAAGDQTIRRLSELKPGHLRADLYSTNPDWKSQLAYSASLAEQVGCGLHLALTLFDEQATFLDQVAAESQAFASLIRNVMVFHRDQPSTSTELLRLARQAFNGFDASITGGTDAFFTELNRNRPEPGSADAISFSLNPQVHAFDNLSVMETLTAQAATVRSAAEFWKGDIQISPVTLRMRWNPNATGKEESVPVDQLPPRVDVRQMSLFGAVWTLGSLAALSRLRPLKSVTWHETHGWTGLMEVEGEGNLKLPHRFHSRPGFVFPVYHVFAELAGAVSSAAVKHDGKLQIAVLVVQDTAGCRRILTANLTQEDQVVLLPVAKPPKSVRILDETTALQAMKDPDAFRSVDGAFDPPENGLLKLRLRPYGMASVECATG